ncbi:peroxiredoxin [Wenyingzhuangia heitensis]|uniref:thioredoxin-dependent peroxiredoxin n=1 Tax=Wenyingzhuangia heitensis TaxID=1487859 RepID=A0ABX0U845_9FLAO|nr:peroxiredoxin-like family protein [Wenyingzhuangia heitensis]NIJ45015.1 peroxiredoxin [Wenyingzhuangia heitensis]
MEKTQEALQPQLDAVKENFEAKADESVIKSYNNGVETVANSGILENAKNVGDKAPNFSLTNALGTSVTLDEYLKKGKVVLTWYRGGWCPYCNLTLRELQQELPNFKVNGATLIALTPELPDKSLSTSEKHNLEFEVLSDVGNKIAKEYGIVFKLNDDVAENHNKAFGLKKYNGDDSNELPLAATYIINQEGEITYAFLDAEYRNRAEPTEITKNLKS